MKTKHSVLVLTSTMITRINMWHTARRYAKTMCAETKYHRRTSQGSWEGGLQPPQTRTKPLFFGQKLHFSAEASSQNMKKTFFLY